VAFNVSVSNKQQKKTSMLALANVEILAEAEGVDDCDIYTFVRNAVEDWEQATFSGRTNAEGYVYISRYKIGPLGANADVTFTYWRGTCSSWETNCCSKEQIGKISLL